MKDPAVRPQGIKLKFFVVIPAKAGIQTPSLRKQGTI